MAGLIPRKILQELNELDWLKTSERHRYEVVEGQKQPVPHPEGETWFAHTGHNEALKLIETVEQAVPNSQIGGDYIGECFGVTFPPSQLPFLAQKRGGIRASGVEKSGDEAL